MMPMPASASCAPSACELSGPLKWMEATAPAVGRTHEKRSAWRARKPSSSTRLLRMMAMFLCRMASLARSAMMACSSLAREGEAVPKYCTSTRRCLRARSWKASHPMVMPRVRVRVRVRVKVRVRVRFRVRVRIRVRVRVRVRVGQG